MNTAIWLVRREFWENRAIWMIPSVLGGLVILAALFGRIDLMMIPSQVPSRAVGGGFLLAIGVTFFIVMSIYSTWYLLDCLYADRKDRSVLFWKSMPISDTTTVMSKLATALIVIPVVYFAAADLTTLMMAFIISVRANSYLGGALWHVDLWLQLQVLWIYVIVDHRRLVPAGRRLSAGRVGLGEARRDALVHPAADGIDPCRTLVSRQPRDCASTRREARGLPGAGISRRPGLLFLGDHGRGQRHHSNADEHLGLFRRRRILLQSGNLDRRRGRGRLDRLRHPTAYAAYRDLKARTFFLGIHD